MQDIKYSKIFILASVFFIAFSSFASAAEKIKFEPANVPFLFLYLDSPSLPYLFWYNNASLAVDGKVIVSTSGKKISKPTFRGKDCVLFPSESGEFMLYCSSGGDVVSYSGKRRKYDVFASKYDIDSAVWSEIGGNCLFSCGKKVYSAKSNQVTKLSDSASDFFISRTGSRAILFRSDAPDKAVIMRTNGTGARNLPSSSFIVEQTSHYKTIRNISPDLDRMVCEKASGGFDIIVLEWNSAPRVVATVLKEYTGNRDAVFSPDGKKIALTMRTKAGRSFMAVLSSSGEVITQFSPKQDWSYTSPFWSPDGNTILWQYATKQKPEVMNCLISNVSGVSISFVGDSITPNEIYWSPSSKAIAYRSSDTVDSSGQYKVFELSAKTSYSILERQPFRSVSKPVWSPDGSKISIIDFTKFIGREKIGDRDYAKFRESLYIYTLQFRERELMN